jgi:broad specificity phosphatase PhoE
MKLAAMLLATMLFGTTILNAADPITTVILVRHAEKASGGGSDPVLSEAGLARAEALARMLAGAHVTAIYASKYQRAKLTAAPTAKAMKLEPTILTEAKDIAADIKAKHLGETVLVVGHANTVPELIGLLGVAKPPAQIDEAEFGNLYICTVAGERASVLRLEY